MSITVTTVSSSDVFGAATYTAQLEYAHTGASYWRVNHDTELWRENLPEVFPFEVSHYTAFGRSLQLLEKSLNPNMINTKWRGLHGWKTAFNNRNGFEDSNDPRADYVNGQDIGADNPKQEALVCGGAVLREVYHDGEYLYPEYIDGNLPAPSLQSVRDRPYLYFDAVTIRSQAGGGIVIGRFPQGLGERVYILLLASKPIKIPLAKVSRVTPPFPSPYRYP